MEGKAYINPVRSKTPWASADASAHRTSNGVKTFVFAIAVFAFLAITPQFVHAATLYFSPSSGAYTTGSTLSVSVYVSSADQAMNAASGVISFPQDKLEVTSLSKSGSIFSLWVQEPSFSNSDGTVNFEGIVLNPGFTGSSGKAITITFRTKAAGNTPLTFSSGSVLANDGKGTNILTGMGDANFAIGVAGPGASETKISAEVAGAPAASIISSPTHPDTGKWYSSSSAKFKWSLPAHTTAVRFIANQIPQAVQMITHTPPVSEKEITDVPDGIWYFHVRLRNAKGWGEISSFRFQIDTQPPEPFSIKFVGGNKTDNPRPTVLFETTDSLSGIDHYNVKIGEGDFVILSSETVKSNPYILPLQAPGKRSILVQAFDKAGNYAVATDEFVIEALESPVIAEWPRELTSGKQLVIKGTTKYINSQVVVWLQSENADAKSQITKSDGKGKFVFVADEKLNDGIYKFWAEVADARGAKSLPTEKLVIAVARPAILQIGSWAVSVLAVVVPLIALVILLLFVIWYGWHRFSMFRKKLRKEVHEADVVSRKAFNLLKGDIRRQVKMLEELKAKRGFTEEEEKVIKQLRKDLDDAEKFVMKEIGDVEKEVK